MGVKKKKRYIDIIKQWLFRGWLCLTAMLACDDLQGQLFSDRDFKFKNYTTKDGLAHDAVRKCAMDSKGFLWVCTEDGLSKFDGVHFTNYGKSYGFPSSFFTDMVIDKHDKIWLAFDFGCCRFDPITKKVDVIRKDGQYLACEKMAYDTTTHQLYIGSRNAGLYQLDMVSLTFTTTSLSYELPNAVRCLFLDKQKRLWIAIERNGVYQYHTKTDTHSKHFKGFWALNVYAVDAENYLLLTWGSGVHKFHPDCPDDLFQYANINVHMNGYENPYIFSISKDAFHPHQYWMATNTTGILLYDAVKSTFIKHYKYHVADKDGIISNFLWDNYTDHYGNIWFAHWSGLSLLNPSRQLFQKGELPELDANMYNAPTSIIDDPYIDSVTWMTVIGTGLVKYNKKTNQPMQFYFNEMAPEKTYIYNYGKRWPIKIHTDDNKVMWCPSYDGLIKIYKGKVSYVTTIKKNGMVNYTETSHLDKANMLWTGSRYLTKFNTRTETAQHYDFPLAFKTDKSYDFLHSIEEGMDHQIVLGTDYGLFSFDTNSHSFTKLPYCEGKECIKDWFNIKCLERIGDVIYIGTPIGVAAYHLYSKKTTIIKDQLTDIACKRFGMVADDLGKLWVLANDAVYRYDPTSGKILKFNKHDGIHTISSDNAYAFKYDNFMYIGHRMAYTKFDPSKIDANKNLPLPVITQMLYGQSEKMAEALSDNVVLDHRIKNINFTFTGIEYNEPEKMAFQWILDGYDNGWSPMSSQRYKNYTNLPPGYYTFRLRAYNNAGIGGQSEATFTFEIKAAFYQTLWFKLLALFSIAGMLVFGIRYRIAAIRKQEEEKTNMHRTIADLDEKLLRSQMNPHFIFNSLNSIQKYIWENKEEDAAEYLAKFAKLMRSILENSRKPVVSLAEEIKTLQLYTELEYRRTNGFFDYAIEVDQSLNLEKTYMPPLLLQPFIENAIWHGLSKRETPGHLQINIMKKDQTLICIVEDNGVGRSKNADQSMIGKKSLGTTITNQRLERLMESTKMKASVETEDIFYEGHPSGTKVTIILPLQYTLQHA